MRRNTALIGCVLLAGLAAAPEAPAIEAASNLMDLSLEELAHVPITSVSPRAQSLSESAGAVYVLTREDMRRSGYRSIAEALRMVPGVQVARTSAHTWSIGARGFNTGFSNKMLVLIDGRSVYSPLFSGVFWELRDVPVEDIDHIEVIRGPGAALWGANAVNGVINIITRHASETRGWTLKGGGGSEEHAFGLVRYGDSLGETTDWRMTASGFQRDHQHRRGAPDDSWWMKRIQGRSDWQPTDRDRVVTTTEFFGGEVDQDRPRESVAAPNAPSENEEATRLGASALTRWEHDLEDGGQVSTQLWYEFTDLEFNTLREERHTVDLDVQHRLPAWKRNELVWGASYRFSYDDIEERGFNTTLDPTHRGIHLATGFLHDDIRVVPDLLTLTLGSKFEYNEFTDFEIQPSARVSVTPNETNTVWAAVSRAVRTPTRLEDDSDLGLLVLDTGEQLPFGDPLRPTLFVLRGNRRFTAEDLLALEAGYRVRPHEDVSLDAAVFYNRYDDLLTAEFGPRTVVGTPPDDFTLATLVVDNEMDGHSWGGEVAGWWQVRPWWRLHASYSYLRISLDLKRGSSDILSEVQEGQSPRHQALLRSSFDLPHDLELDGVLRFVDRLKDADVGSYVELDLRLGWRFCEDWEVAVVGQNLLHRHHQEAADPSTRVQRGVYGQFTWRWEGRE